MLLLVFRSHLRHLQSQCEPIVIVAFSMISFRSGNAKVVISSDLERRRDRKRMARHVMLDMNGTAFGAAAEAVAMWLAKFSVTRLGDL